MAKKVNDKIVNEATTETPQTETLNKIERRNRNLKIKHEAKCKAFNEKLNWYDDIPAAAFHQNFDKAFADATTHPKATELLRDPSLPVTVTAAQVETVATVEQPKTMAEKAAAAVERFEERNKTSAELTVEAAKAALIGSVANDNTETKADEAGTTGTESAEPVQAAEAEAVEETADDNATSTDTVEAADTSAVTAEQQPAEQTETPLVDEFDDKGVLIRREGESGRAYGRRKHAAKQQAAWKKSQVADPNIAAETETRNGEPPTVLPGLPAGKTPAEINKTLPLDLPEAKVDPMLKQPNESKKAWKARIALISQVAAEVAAPTETVVPEKSALESANAFEAAAMGDQTTAEAVPDATTEGTEEATTTENPVADTPAEEAPQEQTPEVQEPVQTEPVSTEAAPGPSEAKTDKKPTLTLVAKDNLTPEETAAAKKFYGTGWKDESAALLCKALFWLNKAVEYDSNIRAGKAPANPKINPRVSYRLAMNAALKHEAEAFGNKPVELSLTEVVRMFADFPDNHQKAA